MAKKEQFSNEEKVDPVAGTKPDIKIIIDGQEFIAKYRQFASKRCGYGLYGTTKIQKYPFRMSINIIEM